MVDFLLYFANSYEEYQAVDISQIVNQDMIRDEGTNNYQKLFYNKKGPFAHGQRVMNVITEQYKVK